jgi:hypothetical protein
MHSSGVTGRASGSGEAFDQARAEFAYHLWGNLLCRSTSMGDTFRTIVDREATLAEAPTLADHVSSWLIEQRIIACIRTDCILGSREGYPPGPRFAYALDKSQDPLGIFATGTRRLSTNGLDIVMGRTVFDSGQGGQILCPSCGKEPASWEGWQDAIAEWLGSSGPALLKCTLCGREAPVTEWKYDPPWAFGNLGFTFWNWPPFSQSFVAEISRILGHPTVVICGKL